MATKNDITGDSLVSRGPTDSYRDNYDRIFGKKNKVVEEEEEDKSCDEEEDGTL